MNQNTDESKEKKDPNRIAFESLEILVEKWMDGSLTEILDDWKWIFSYSKKYKGAILFYTVLGIFNTSMSF